MKSYVRVTFCLISTALIFLFSGISAFGQDTESLDSQEFITESVKSELWSKLNTGPDGNLMGDKSGVVLSVYGKDAKLNLDYRLPTSVRPAASGDGVHQVWSYGLSASVPSDPGSKSTPLPSFDGLKDAYAVGLKISYSRIPPDAEAFEHLSNLGDWEQAKESIASRFLAGNPSDSACREEFTRKVLKNQFGGHLKIVHLDKFGTDWGKIPELAGMNIWEAINFTVKKVSFDDGLSKNQEIALRDLNRLVEDLSSHVNPDSELIRVCVPGLYEKTIKDAWTVDRLSKSFGLEAKLGNDRYEYLSPETFESQKDIKSVYSLTVFGTLYKAADQGARNLTVSGSYQKTYKPREESTKCLNMAMNPEEDCRTAVFDPPVEDDNVILSVEWRSGIADLPLAYSLKGSFDFEDNTYGVELPIYLFSFGGEDLNAGVRLGWQSETEKAGVGFFYGQKF